MRLPSRPVIVLPVLLAVLMLGLTSLDARADLDGKRFHFGTHAARTNVTFVSEADVETIHGHTNTLDGSVEVAASGRLAGGRFVIPVASLRTGIDLGDEHLCLPMWLDASKHPSLELRLTKATPTRSDRTWSYEGTLSIKGVAKPVKGTVEVRFIPEAIAKQARLGPGAWVRVKAKFEVSRSDFCVEIPQGIGPQVSEVIDIGADVYGTTTPPRRSWTGLRGGFSKSAVPDGGVLARPITRGALLAAVVALLAFPVAWLFDARALEVQEIRPLDEPAVAANQLLFRPGDDVVDVYGTRPGAPVRVLFIDESRVVRPPEDVTLALYPTGDEFVLPMRSVFYAAKWTTLAAAIAAGVLAVAESYLRQRRAALGTNETATAV